MFSNLKISAVIFFAVHSSAFVLASDPKGSISLTITNIRSNKGEILISVFNQPSGFPSDSSRAFRTYKVEAKSPQVTLNIPVLPSGQYAVAIIHDENNNSELDTNLIGAPVEGYAASGSNRRFSAPRFEASKFEVSEKPVTLRVSMSYLF